MSEATRAPDELDALLQRIDEEDPLSKGSVNITNSHRKSYSVDVGGTGSSNIPGHSARKSRRTRHRKNKSSISELYEAIRNVDLQPIREDFRETAKSLKTNFVQGLDEMDRGETGFFDMSMTRSLSILPDNIPALAQEAGVAPGTDLEEQGPPLLQYFALLGAVVGISSNSTALHMLDGVEAPLKLYWRMTASFVALIPLTIHYLMRDGLPSLSLSGWLTFLSAAVAFATQNLFYYSSLEYTTIGNAVIYANSQALLLIIGKAFVGERIHLLEGLGVVIAFSGAILCSQDSERSARAADRESAIFGDILALLSAVAGVAYLTFAKSVRSQMSVTVFIFSVMVVGSFFVLLFIALNRAEPLNWDTNPYDGVFGWMNPTNHRLEIVMYLAVVCNMIGTMGFVRGRGYVAGSSELNLTL